MAVYPGIPASFTPIMVSLALTQRPVLQGNTDRRDPKWCWWITPPDIEAVTGLRNNEGWSGSKVDPSVLFCQRSTRILRSTGLHTF